MPVSSSSDEDNSRSAPKEKSRHVRPISFPGEDSSRKYTLELHEFDQDVEDEFHRAFKRLSNSSGCLDIKRVDRVIMEAKLDIRETERQRVQEMIPRVLTKEELKKGIALDTLWALLEGCVSVEMLNALFHDESIRDDKKLEPRCTYSEVCRMFDRIFFCIRMSESRFQELFNEGGGGDDDGQLVWEELLHLFQKVLGPQLRIAKTFGVKHETDSHRRGVSGLKDKLGAINYDIKMLDTQISNKQDEIAKTILSSAMDNARNKMHEAWDRRDQVELHLFAISVAQFKEMQQFMIDNDKEKRDLKTRYERAIVKRDNVRNNEALKMDEFGNLLVDSFSAYPGLAEELERISKFSSDIHNSMQKGTELYAKAEKAWQGLGRLEKPPKPSSSTDAIEFLQSQRSMVSEIGTKLRIMQQERDKYEDMIEKEVAINKAKRIECINLNMKITSHEAKMLALEAKQKDLQIQRATLDHQLKEKNLDKDSKKNKELKNTLWQFEAEKEEVEKAVDETRSKLRVTDQRIAESRATTSRLNIELGELKIILEGIKNYENSEMKNSRIQE